ncbi:MAG TPA: SMI1/KNR4 family protein [Lacunisphaera sp.]|nr:SMI1/KNR4 family protein [Lacunisphaera sp.]
MKHPRIIGTTDEAIARAEAALGRTFPASFRKWLLANNGLGIDDVTIFPVFDERDPRKTWESIDRRFRESWAAWLRNFEDEGRDFTHLLPFAEYGTGDFYCFDFRAVRPGEECPVVRWSHETGDTEIRAKSFAEFSSRAAAGNYWND